METHRKENSLRKIDCGSQWRTPTGKKFALGECADLTKLSVQGSYRVIAWYWTQAVQSYEGIVKKAHEFCGKVLRVSQISGDDHLSDLGVMEDYVMGDSVLSRVYYGRDLRHNLFSWHQFVNDIDDEIMKILSDMLAVQSFKSKSWFLSRLGKKQEVLPTAKYLNNRKYGSSSTSHGSVWSNESPRVFKGGNTSCHVGMDYSRFTWVKVLEIQHQEIAEDPIHEDTPIIHDVLHPSHNLVTGDPGSAQSSSGNVNSAEPNQVNYPPDHLRRWTKDHPLDNIVGNPSHPVSTRKQLASDALWPCIDEFHKFDRLEVEVLIIKNRLLVARIEAIRIFIANAATKNMIIYRWMFKTAFSNGDLQEGSLCQSAPEGLRQENSTHVDRLKRPLYGRKAWHRGRDELRKFQMSMMGTNVVLLRLQVAQSPGDIQLTKCGFENGWLPYGLLSSRPDLVFAADHADVKFQEGYVGKSAIAVLSFVVLTICPATLALNTLNTGHHFIREQVENLRCVELLLRGNELSTCRHLTTSDYPRERFEFLLPTLGHEEFDPLITPQSPCNYSYLQQRFEVLGMVIDIHALLELFLSTMVREELFADLSYQSRLQSFNRNWSLFEGEISIVRGIGAWRRVAVMKERRECFSLTEIWEFKTASCVGGGRRNFEPFSGNALVRMYGNVDNSLSLEVEFYHSIFRLLSDEMCRKYVTIYLQETEGTSRLTPFLNVLTIRHDSASAYAVSDWRCFRSFGSSGSPVDPLSSFKFDPPLVYQRIRLIIITSIIRGLVMNEFELVISSGCVTSSGLQLLHRNMGRRFVGISSIVSVLPHQCYVSRGALVGLRGCGRLMVVAGAFHKAVSVEEFSRNQTRGQAWKGVLGGYTRSIAELVLELRSQPLFPGVVIIYDQISVWGPRFLWGEQRLQSRLSLLCVTERSTVEHLRSILLNEVDVQILTSLSVISRLCPIFHTPGQFLISRKFRGRHESLTTMLVYLLNLLCYTIVHAFSIEKLTSNASLRTEDYISIEHMIFVVLHGTDHRNSNTITHISRFGSQQRYWVVHRFASRLLRHDVI
ncbi:hypothetical protein Tco_1353312 [Tanacetum coccineum]